MAGEAQASRFLELVEAALALPDSRLVVVATLRADHLAAPLGVPGLGDRIRVGTELVTPLTRDELERAVARPADRVGVALEPGLATRDRRRRRNPARGAAPAPVRPDGALRATGRTRASPGRRTPRWEALRGRSASRAEEAWQGLGGEGREVARQLFLRLAAPGETGEPAGRRVARSDLGSLAADDVAVDAVLDEFGRRRLLAFDRDPVTGAATVEVAHDALLGRWPRLAGWIGEARDDLSMRRRLADATADWEASGRDPDFLLAGSRLELFAGWSSSTDLRLDASERALVQASVAARDRRTAEETVRAARERALDRRATTRLRALAAVLAAAVLVASTLSVALYTQSTAAGEQATIALARERAAAAIGNLGTDPRLSLLLAWQAAATTAGPGLCRRGGARRPPLVAPGVPRRLSPGSVGSSASGPNPAARGASRSCRRNDSWPSPPPSPAGTSRRPSVAPTSTPPTVRLRRRQATCPPGWRSTRARASSPSTASPPRRWQERGWTSWRSCPWTPDRRWQASSTGRVSRCRPRRTTPRARSSIDGWPLATSPTWPSWRARRRSPGWRGPGCSSTCRGSPTPHSRTTPPAPTSARSSRSGRTGSWPAASGTLVGAPFATTDESLVWYPEAAFAEAGYRVPRTSAELATLVDRIEADGGVAWCLGLLGGAAGAADAVGIVEDAVLEIGGTRRLRRAGRRPDAVLDLRDGEGVRSPR